MAPGLLEAQVLAAIKRLGNGAYAVKIDDAVEADTGRRLSNGYIYTVLAKLRRSRHVKSWWSEPEPVVGGRRCRVYELTSKGRAVLSSTRKALQGRRRA